jgi:sterol desaturase/sphingolipid hydroxylase (fatty acid hydroxylase superfamily)
MEWEKFSNHWFKVAEMSTIRYFSIAGLAFFVFYYLLRGVFSKRKMQSKFPEISHYGRDILFSLITILIFATTAALVFSTLRPFTQLYQPWDQLGKGYYFLTFPLMFLIHDVYFYVIHRLMHQPKLYRYIHRVHHLSTNPSPWTAYAFHPLEAILEAGIIPLIVFTLPVAPSAFGLFMLFQFSYNVYGHLGYELFPARFAKTWIGRWVNTGTAHNLHHQYFHGNYGLYTLIWDRLFGTLRKDYDAKYEQVTSKSGKENLEKQSV